MNLTNILTTLFDPKGAVTIIYNNKTEKIDCILNLNIINPDYLSYFIELGLYCILNLNVVDPEYILYYIKLGKNQICDFLNINMATHNWVYNNLITRSNIPSSFYSSFRSTYHFTFIPRYPMGKYYFLFKKIESYSAEISLFFTWFFFISLLLAIIYLVYSYNPKLIIVLIICSLPNMAYSVPNSLVLDESIEYIILILLMIFCALLYLGFIGFFDYLQLRRVLKKRPFFVNKIFNHIFEGFIFYMAIMLGITGSNSFYLLTKGAANPLF